MFSQIAREIQSIPVCLRDKEAVPVAQKAWRVNLVEFPKSVKTHFRRAPLLRHTQQAHEMRVCAIRFVVCERVLFACVEAGSVMRLASDEMSAALKGPPQLEDRAGNGNSGSIENAIQLKGPCMLPLSSVRVITGSRP